MRCRCSKSTTDTCVGRTDSNNNATEGADATSVALILTIYCTSLFYINLITQ